MSNLLSVTQAAQLAACTRRYILDEIERWQRGENGLPAEKIGNQYAIRREDFDKWLKKPTRGSRKKETMPTFGRQTIDGQRIAVSQYIPSIEKYVDVFLVESDSIPDFVQSSVNGNLAEKSTEIRPGVYLHTIKWGHHDQRSNYVERTRYELHIVSGTEAANDIIDEIEAQKNKEAQFRIRPDANDSLDDDFDFDEYQKNRK